MDFVVLGFGTGALAVLLGLGLRDLGPWFGRVSPGRELAPSAVARLVGRGRGCRAGGLVLALAGGAVLLVTVAALAAGAGDRVGLIVVAATLVLTAGGALTWLLRYLRFAHPDLWSSRRAAEPIVPAVAVDRFEATVDFEPAAPMPSHLRSTTDAWTTARWDEIGDAPVDPNAAVAVGAAAPSAPPTEPDVVAADRSVAVDVVPEPEPTPGPEPATAVSETVPDPIDLPSEQAPVVQTATTDDPLSDPDPVLIPDADADSDPDPDPDPSAGLAEPDERVARDEPPNAEFDEVADSADLIAIARNGRPPLTAEHATDDRADPLAIGPTSRGST